jgi:hypothetical protein
MDDTLVVTTGECKERMDLSYKGSWGYQPLVVSLAETGEVLRLDDEDYAEFGYQPTECDRPYRMVVVRKKIAHEKGQRWRLDEVRYFFYITNDWAIDAEDVVFEANDRCNQENLIAQLAGGVR